QAQGRGVQQEQVRPGQAGGGRQERDRARGEAPGIAERLGGEAGQGGGGEQGQLGRAAGADRGAEGEEGDGEEAKRERVAEYAGNCPGLQGARGEVLGRSQGQVSSAPRGYPSRPVGVRGRAVRGRCFAGRRTAGGGGGRGTRRGGGPPSATGGGRGDAGGGRGGRLARPDIPVALRALVLMMRSLFEFSLVIFCCC
ncbi:unnamed protein product, partial [Ectocarpus fasciculatus]